MSDTKEVLECGHPVECAAEHGDCRWCSEVYSLKSHAQALEENINKQGIIINGGTSYVYSKEVGYLVANKGATIYFKQHI